MFNLRILGKEALSLVWSVFILWISLFILEKSSMHIISQVTDMTIKILKDDNVKYVIFMMLSVWGPPLFFTFLFVILRFRIKLKLKNKQGCLDEIPVLKIPCFRIEQRNFPRLYFGIGYVFKVLVERVAAYYLSISIMSLYYVSYCLINNINNCILTENTNICILNWAIFFGLISFLLDVFLKTCVSEL